jgi:4-amino-4-deoxy-L-arabinose transferase-like glycosyltransferase
VVRIREHKLDRSRNRQSTATFEPSPGSLRGTYLPLLLAVFMVGLALRLYALDADSLWLDEIFTATTSQMGLWSIPGFLATSDSHPPLLFLTAKLGASLWGNSEFILRLPAALLGSMSIVLAYKVGTVFWGRKEGLIAAFLLSINAYHIRYSQEARNYSAMVFLALLSLIFLLLALQHDRKRMWLLFTVCASLNLYTHNFAFLILTSEALFAAWLIFEAWWSSRNQPVQAGLESGAAAPSQHRLLSSTDRSSVPGAGAATSGLPRARKLARHLVASLVLVGLLYLPWFPFLRQQILGRIIGFTGLGFGEPHGAHLSVQFFSNALQEYTGMDGALVLLFLTLFAIGLASSRVRYTVLSCLWVVPPFVVPFIARSGHYFSLKYAIFVVPLLMLGMARGISVLADWLAHRLPVARQHGRWALAGASILIVSVVGAVAVVSITKYYYEQKTDYRGVASYLDHTLLPGDVILVDGVRYRTGEDADWTKMCLSYYISSARLRSTPLLPVDRTLGTSLQSMAQRRGEVVAVVARRSRPASWDRQTDIVVIDFQDLSVIHLRQSSGDMLLDAKAMLEALLKLLRRPDARFDVRLALAETYVRMGLFTEAASQIVLAGRDVADDNRAANDLAQTVTQLQPYLHVQTEETRVGDSLSLRGYSQQPTALRAGETITLDLWWETREQMDVDYTTFVHVIGPDGRIVVQEDKLLRSRARPTSSWRVGEVVRDEHQLVLPPDAEPGHYVVTTGVYYWQTGERLPAWDEQGQRQPDDAIPLGSITVTENAG